LNGDVESIELLPYSGESDAVEALNNGKVDVVAGAKAQIQYDLGGPSIPGVYFTTPYLYGNETAREGVTMITMATREDDEMFCSFVNLVVLAPTNAQVMGINQQRSDDMPLVSVFGGNIAWALRDAIGQSGNYYEILAGNDMEGTKEVIATIDRWILGDRPSFNASTHLDIFVVHLRVSSVSWA